MMSPGSLRADHVAMLVGGGALALLLAALAYQYLGGLHPCEMCHWQRWAHIGAALAGLGGTWVLRRQARLLAVIAILLVLVSGAIAAYQTGMQMGYLPGPASCSGQRFVMGSNVVPVIQCDVVTWRLFGLSMASYNAILSLLIAALGISALLKART